MYVHLCVFLWIKMTANMIIILRALALGGVNTLQLLFYNQNLKKLAPFESGFTNYFATYEQLVLIYRTNYSFGCKIYIYIYIYYFIEKICSLSHFFSDYASPSFSKLQSSPLSTLYTSPWPQSSKLFSLSTFPHDPYDFRWWVLVMA